VTFHVLLNDGRRAAVPGHGYDVVGEFVQFYWLDENGYRRPATMLRRADVRAVALTEGNV
jgi:hypothetical protein